MEWNIEQYIQDRPSKLRWDVKKVLVVDDDPVMRDTISRGLFLYGYDYVTASSTWEAIEILKSKVGRSVDLMLADLSEPGKFGMELVQNVLRLRPALPVIVVKGLKSSPTIEALRALGLTILPKPFDPDVLDETIMSAIPKGEMEVADD